MRGYKNTETSMLPNDWVVKELKDINTYKNRTINPTLYKDEIFEYYSIPAYQNGEKPEFSKGSLIQSNKFLFDEGTVVFGKLNPRVEKVWRIGNISAHRKIGTTEWIAVKPNDEITTDFLYFLEWSVFVMPLAKTLVTGSTPSRQRVDPTSFYKIKIPIPPIIEQQRITYILNTIKKAIAIQEQIIQNTVEMKRSLMKYLFSEGVSGQKLKQSEVGLIPVNWNVKSLIEIVDFIDYGVSQAIPKQAPNNGIKIVSTADITKEGDLLYDQIRTIEVPQRTAQKLKLNDGDLLFNWRNSAELIGKSTIFHEQSEPHIFASFILRINCGERKSHNYFLKYLMNHYREEGVFIKLSRRAVNQANFNRNEISVLPIPVPPYQEQVEIAKLIGTVERKINHHKNKRDLLYDLFKTLLNDLVTGQRRVDKIDFRILSKEYEAVEAQLDLAAEI